MKRAPWFMLAGVVAGFASVLGLHGKPVAPAAGAGPQGHRVGSTPAKDQPSSAPTAQASQAAGPAGSATGSLEQYGYGELDVKVTVAGKRITNVTVPTLRTAEQYSQQLAAQVIPMLKSQVLQVQSGRINGVSGATYTSEAYAMSLQSALDKLHIK